MADSTFQLQKITNDFEKIYLENSKKYEKESKELSRIRKNSAVKLDSFINNEFPALKLENAKFKSFF